MDKVVIPTVSEVSAILAESLWLRERADPPREALQDASAS